MIRFYIALWSAKLMAFIYKLRGQERNDLPGLLATKIDPDFLKKVNKPKITVAITGTNGKTTTSALINNFLKSQGYKTSFNDWGANLRAGFALNLMRGVSIFNKVRIDASVLEADELSMNTEMSSVSPNYVLVTNICKDSLRRNGHPENIFNHIEGCMQTLKPDAKVVLNGNDPISFMLAEGKNRVYYEMEDIGINPLPNISKDIAVCPKCLSEIEYEYRHYRHIGKFKCKNCDFATPDAKYFGTDIDLNARTITVDGYRYPLISDTVFNAFNVLSAISMLREMGFSAEKISAFLETQKVTDIRESCVECNGIKVYAYAAKAQNVSAASTVFEYMAKEPSEKDVVLLLDEVQDKNHPTETLTWIYETDYEFLNTPNIRKIIVGGHMYLNHKLRMLLADIPEEKIVAVESEDDIPKHVDKEGISKIYVLYEIDYVSKAKRMRDKIAKELKEGK